MTQSLYTVKEFMQITKLSRSAAYKLLGNEIPIVRLGRKILVPGWFVRKLTAEPEK